jgi:2-haloacid dehalogenase
MHPLLEFESMKPRGVIFDAYGTLFDVHSILRRGWQIQGDLLALSTLWRRKQVEYTWRRALMKNYVDFWQVTEDALQRAVAELLIEVSERDLTSLMEAYLSPEIFPDVRPALDTLQAVPLAILSNGSLRMLEEAVRANGLEARFDHVISVDEVRTYKPDPEVYGLGTKALRAPSGEILFVSSNAWDAAGAKAFGYRVCWCNRSGEAPDCMGFDPDLIIGSLDALSSLF